MINRVVLMGRLTADPELRQTPNGVAVASFSVAVNRSYSSKSGERQTDFINIVAWRQTAEFVSRYFHKGNMIALDGSIQTRSYTDKNGNKRTAFEVVAENVSFCESKASQNAAPQEAMPSPAAPAVSYSSGSVEDFAELDTDDDLPF